MSGALSFLAVVGERVFAASVGAALLGGAVWALTRGRRCGLTPALRAWLWWLVAAKAVLALAWTLPVPWPRVWSAPPAVVDRQASGSPAGAQALGQDSSAPAASPMRAPGSVEPLLGSSVRWPAAIDWVAGAPAAGLGALWLLGAAASLAFGVRQSLATRALMRQSIAASDPALLDRVSALAERLGYRRRIRLLHCASLDCPAVAGMLRPLLLLPAPESQRLDPEQWDLALAHELVHLRRGDLVWGLLPALAERLFFFHPLVRRAAREYALARESACDLAVVAELRPPPERYGRLLLRLGVLPPRSAWTLAAASPTHGLLKRRLEMLHESRVLARFTPGRLGLVALIVALAAVPWRFAEPAAAMMPLREAGAGRAADPSTASSVRSSSSRSSTHISESGTTYGYYGDEMAFALLRGDAADSKVSISGNTRGLAEARRLHRAGQDVLWFRLGADAYVVRDRAALDRFEELLAPQQQLGAEQGKLGGRQGELGAKQGDLGARQGELGARQGELGARQARLAAEVLAAAGAEVSRAARGDAEAAGNAVGDLSRKMEELAKEQARLGEAQAELGTRQAELGTRQAELGKLQAELGELQAKAAAVFEGDAERLLRDLVSKGLAEAVR